MKQEIPPPMLWNTVVSVSAPTEHAGEWNPQQAYSEKVQTAMNLSSSDIFVFKLLRERNNDGDGLLRLYTEIPSIIRDI